MRLWLIEKRQKWDEPTYDRNNGFVIAANDEFEARKWAASQIGDEISDGWLNTELSSCTELSGDMPQGIVLADFHAG